MKREIPIIAFVCVVCVGLAVVGFAAFASSVCKTEIGLVAGRNVLITPVDTANASVQVLVRDVTGGMWHSQWRLEGGMPGDVMHVSAGIRNSKAGFGFNIPVSTKKINLELVAGKDVSGSQDGLTYEVRWKPTPRQRNRDAIHIAAQ